METEGQMLGHSRGQLEVLSRDKWRKLVVDLCSTWSTRDGWIYIYIYIYDSDIHTTQASKIEL